MDRTVLEQWWSPAPVDFIQEVGEQASTWPMWPALVLLAGILLIVETVYVHLLCPKADPRTADAVVTRRGVLKPVSQEAFSQEA